MIVSFTRHGLLQQLRTSPAGLNSRIVKHYAVKTPARETQLPNTLFFVSKEHVVGRNNCNRMRAKGTFCALDKPDG